MSDQASIKASIERAVEHYASNPDDAAGTDSLATARLLDGLRFEVRDPDGRTITTDMVTGIGGENSAPSPGWLLRAAVASCDATLIAMHAARSGIALTQLEVDVDSESNDLGILGIDPGVPKGPIAMRTRVRVASPDADAATLRSLVENAIDHCPVCDAVKRAVPVSVEIDIGR